MTNYAGDRRPQPDQKPLDLGASKVAVTINGCTYVLHRGNASVAQLKALDGIPAAHELEQVVGGQLGPLADDGRITIKGGEVFVSHPRTGACS